MAMIVQQELTKEAYQSNKKNLNKSPLATSGYSWAPFSRLFVGP